ncbi:MAG: nodulation protein NfeD [Deltaproteobacteria bacterium]|nr:nodulation protein NfeD [Deltaproteobacteria bacterium]
MKSIRIIAMLVALLAIFIGTCAGAGQGDVYVMRVADAISPAITDFIIKGIAEADRDRAACLIVELDTPGGLVEATRKIVMAIYAAHTPVVVFVSPGGARAASAGVMITMAADIAAMAPGTNIGAAHPVGGGGRDIGETMSEKVTNDVAAFAKSIAERRKRNVEWAEKAVRESVSVTEKEALAHNVIDVVAEDVEDLVRQIDGREVEGKGRLSLAGAERKNIHETMRTRILKTISNPNIAYILMMIGLAGIYFELSHPGVIFPGAIGGIALVLAFFAFQTLPVNYAGILLIVLAIVFFILEMKIASFGLLSVAGVVSLFLGSLMLFEGDAQGFGLSWRVFLPTVLLVSGFFILVAGLAFRAQVAKPRTGGKGLIGEIGVVKKRLAPEGKVFVHGELWFARARETIEEGSKVRVVAVKNLVLDVERE